MSKSARKISPSININLLPQERFHEAGLGKVIVWLLTVGRYLIIVTEIIVLIVFAMRFKLDEDRRTLGESIETKQRMIRANTKLENDVRALQARLAVIKSLRDQHSSFFEILTDITAIFPKDGQLKDLSYDKDKISLKGELLTPESLQALINSFTRSDLFKDLEISELTTPSTKSPVYTFSASVVPIQTNLKKSKAAIPSDQVLGKTTTKTAPLKVASQSAEMNLHELTPMVSSFSSPAEARFGKIKKESL